MSVITISKGEEFKISIKDEIREDDIFINEYQRAADMLDEIAGASMREEGLGTSWSWERGDFENNVIAFCGERGEGKSSAMLTFVNAVCKPGGRKSKIFASCRNLQNAYFAEPVLIDPSLFDEVHNVLEIVLAKIFNKFYEKYNEEYPSQDEKIREALIDRFQKVYGYVSLINNQKQMLDREFDYEGNISTLTKLGKSTDLKEELTKLITEYLKFMQGDSNKDSYLILAIDDLDLCSSNAYKMAEQIRKYLIIPHVVIVMSVKIDQLELCVREQNLHDYEKLYQNREEGIYQNLNKEVQTMAERYVAKLIPKIRRIYLPKVQSLHLTKMIYKNGEEEETLWQFGKTERTLITAMLGLIYSRTGMRFLPGDGGFSYLLPNNLRDMISWVAMLAGLKRVPKNKKNTEFAGNGEDTEEQNENEHFVYYENILKFSDYYIHERVGNDLKSYQKLTLQDLAGLDVFHLQVAVRTILEELCREIDQKYWNQYQFVSADRPDSYFQVILLFELLSKSALDKDTEAYVYQLRTLYTIRLNSLWRSKTYGAMGEFIGGYLWGPGFSPFLPTHAETNVDRARFSIGTIQAYNTILSYLEGQETLEKLELPEPGKQYYLRNIPEDDRRETYIMAWIVLGVLSNIAFPQNNQVVYSSNATIINGNRMVYQYVQISLENYLIALCDLEKIYNKLNLGVLGVSEEEFQNIVRGIILKNQCKIGFARQMVSNVDLVLNIKEYCVRNKEFKDGSKTDFDLSRRLVRKFFKNIVDCLGDLEKNFVYDEMIYVYFGKPQWLIHIDDLYADLFELCIGNAQEQEQMEAHKNSDEQVVEFRKRLIQIPIIWSHEDVRAPKTLRNLTANHVKGSMDKLAAGVERYLGENQRPPQGMDVSGLCELYKKVVDLYLQDQNAKISQELYNEYKRLVLFQDNMNSEPERQ